MCSSDSLQTALSGFRCSLEQGRLAHAYLVVGDARGHGVAFADAALQLLLCTGDTPPCGACRACRQALERTHPDMFWIEPAKKSRAIAIEQIRELSHRIAATSFSGGWKVAVLVEADRLGQAAANAFLKTLEEPPGESLFLLLTDNPQSLLPTIVSRCQRLVVSGFDTDRTGAWRERLAALFDRSCHDDPLVVGGAAQELLAFLAERQAAIEAEIQEESDAEALEEDKDRIAARASARYRAERTSVIRALLLWYRDIFVCACRADERLLAYPEHAALLRRHASGLDFKDAMSNMRAVEEIERLLERNLPESIVIEHAFGSFKKPKVAAPA